MFEGLLLLMSHGISGYLIIITGIFCLLISAERIYVLFFTKSFDSRQAVASIKQAVLSGNYSQALQICSQQENNPELKAIKEGLISVENGREAMRSALGSTVLEVSKSCEHRLSFLSLIASSATLLGLFGTIMGLITTFKAIAGADPTTKARMLGLGISEAMYSTAAGVIVGVLAMAVHTICTSKVDTIVGKVQKVCLDLMNWIEYSERSSK